MDDASEQPVSKHSKEHKAVLERAMRRLKRWDDVMGDNARQAVEDVRFSLLGEQWDDGMLKDREGRPSLTINKLAQYINQVVNEQRQAKQAIKVVGVDSKADRKVAEIETGLIRNIEYLSRADLAYETAYESAVAGGMGYFGVVTCYADEDTFDQDIRIRTFENFLAVKLDCDAIMPDGSDSEWGFVEDKMSLEEFEAEHGKYMAGDVPDSYAEAWHDDDDVYIREYWERSREKCKLTLWSDGVTRKEGEEVPAGATSVRDREAYEHKVKMYKLAGDRVISESEFASRYIPIFPVYGKKMNVEGKVHIMGLVRFARDAQKMFNYWRSSMAEKIALAPKAPLMATPKMMEGFENIYQNAHNKPFPVLPFNPDSAMPGGYPTRVSADGDVSSILMANQSAEVDIKAAVGIHDPVLGINEGQQSGRAIMALQKQGDTATFNYADNLSRAKAQCGRVIVELIGKLYDTPRIVRVLGEDGKYTMAELNKQVPIPGGAMQILNDVTVGKYDVEVTTGPSFATKRIETTQSMLDFIQAVPPAGPILGPDLAKLQDWPGAEELAEKLAQLVPGAQNGPAMAQQVAEQAKKAMQAMEQGFAAKLKEAEDTKDIEWAKLKLKAREIKIDADKAENDRLKMAADLSALSPQIAALVQQLVADMQVEASAALEDELADAAMPGDEYGEALEPMESPAMEGAEGMEMMPPTMPQAPEAPQPL